VANGDVQTLISDAYLQNFGIGIAVAGMQKIQSFPELQILCYNGILGSLKQDFHGLQDFYEQMAAYSSTNQILQTAWSVINPIVPNNANIELMLFVSTVLGVVGDVFELIHGYAQVFGLSPTNLASPSSIASTVSSFA
jgi:hypothetical protein